ncbi:GntR family transcriptional regulator [Mycolicibacterium palauense]|uniref:GntR family transcriptional regulator n=1 Tax=Mycolicibacterium palauense TaxID=2034511 RepID=UPI000BFEC8F9|nr:GntR family transcriptional regulator [Mycolicibacterium palauense]
MPKKYGAKEKDQVVAHVVNLILTGKLRTGDRIDRNELAQDLGVSRVPVQEAVVQLEHDGILTTRYHRGAFVERFDESVVREYHELHGLLTGLASARAAADRNPALLAELERRLQTMRRASEPGAFQDAAFEFRRTLCETYAGPRLLALIRASQSFLPRPFWAVYQASREQLLPFLEAEVTAIAGGDPEAARAANTGRAQLMAEIMLTELARRGIIEAPR